VWIIPFVPFLNGYLHLTTPFNIAFLFAILTVFATLAYLKNKLSMSVPLLLSASALACHVLVGAPIVVFVAGALALKKWEYHRATVRSVIVSTGGAILLIVPILFTIRNITLGLGLPSLAASPIAHFFNLFMRPYWYANTAPRIFELLYGWAWCIVPAVIFLGLFGMYIKKDERHIHLFFLTGAASVFFSAWLLRSFIVFPDVAAYEQGDFPLRLIKLSLIFLLPFAMYGTYGITKKIAVRKLLLIIFYTLFAGALTLSLYLAYPQHNPKSRFPGLNVTASDVKTATWIHNQHQEYDYVVLANQLVSAAALKTYSFAHYFQTEHGELFYYSIPTGGALYQEYGRMLYEGQKRKYMEATMDLVDVDTAYFVLNSYWANAEDIIEGAKKTADRWHTIDDGALWIFVYERN
jgi:hypothetical protein